MDDSPPAARTLDARTVRSALVYAFVGLILVILDVRIAVGTPPAYAIDILNDTIGYGLLAWGQLRLAGQPGPARFGTAIRVALVVTLVELVWSVIVQVTPVGTFGQTPVLFFTLIDLAGILVFCFAMRELSRGHGLTASLAYWALTLRVAAAMWGALVIVLFVVLAILAGGVGGIGWIRVIALLGLPLALVPLLHIESALMRMRQELGRPGPQEPGSRVELLIGTILIGALAVVLSLVFIGGPLT